MTSSNEQSVRPSSTLNQLSSPPHQHALTSLLHQRPIMASDRWICTLCSRPFDSKSELYEHKRKEHAPSGKHSTSRKHQCPLCGKCVSDASNLNRHMKCHTGGLNLQCKICDKVLTNKRNYLGHMNLHTGNKSFKCCWCSESFATDYAKQQHKLTCRIQHINT